MRALAFVGGSVSVLLPLNWTGLLCLPTLCPWQRFPGLCKTGLFPELTLFLGMLEIEDFMSMFGSCGLWGCDTCPGLGQLLLSDIVLIPSPSNLCPSALLPALLLQRRGTSHVAFSSCWKVTLQW